MGEWFINPWFVAGAAGASVPLIIHLLVRRRYNRLPWAAMDLLLRAYKKTNRRLRLENWLVLFLRMLAVLLVAFALARPVLRGGSVVAKIGERNRSVFLLLDDSYSMSYQRGRRTPFEEARKAAADILATLKPGSDSVSLILVSAQPDIVYGEPTPELDKVKQALGDAQPGHAASDLCKGLEALLEILAMPAVKRAPNKEVYFLTDGQKLAWVPPAGGGTLELTKKLAELAGKVETFSVVMVGGEEMDNVGVLDLLVEDRVVGVEKFATFTVMVANHGP
ncbi:MAG: BatA domain-containing protein, partial [Planctomycetota bacterium]